MWGHQFLLSLLDRGEECLEIGILSSKTCIYGFPTWKGWVKMSIWCFARVFLVVQRLLGVAHVLQIFMMPMPSDTWRCLFDVFRRVFHLYVAIGKSIDILQVVQPPKNLQHNMKSHFSKQLDFYLWIISRCSFSTSILISGVVDVCIDFEDRSYGKSKGKGKSSSYDDYGTWVQQLCQKQVRLFWYSIGVWRYFARVCIWYIGIWYNILFLLLFIHTHV